MRELNAMLVKENTSGNTINEIEKRFKELYNYTEEEVENNLQSALTSCSYFDVHKKTYKFNELEEKLLECNGTCEKEIEGLVANMLEGLVDKPLESIVTGKSIIECIEKIIEMKTDLRINKFFLRKAKSTFLASYEMKKQSDAGYNTNELKGKSHVLGDVVNSLKHILYENFIKPPGEWDFLVILNNLKIMLNVEVKRQLNLKNRVPQNLNSSLKSASHQCEEHADYASRVFTPFLSPDWRFVKIAAILPGELDRSIICDHCLRSIHNYRKR